MARKRTYFDYAATTPLATEVQRAMEPFVVDRFGNAGSIHHEGQEAINALDQARARVATTLQAAFREVVFTGSATEANNIALQGTIAAHRRAHPQQPQSVVISTLEHDSIMQTCAYLHEQGVEVRYVPVGRDGRVRVDDVVARIDATTVLVSIMMVSNEVGSRMPIEAIATEVRSRRGATSYPRIHTDASQAFAYLPCVPHELGVDLMTVSAHKVGGPKGVGVLYVSGGAPSSYLQPVLYGGGQEYGLRPGTENVAGIVGGSVALERAAHRRDKASARARARLNEVWEVVAAAFPRSAVNGPSVQRGTGHRAPHILNVYIPQFAAERLVTALDLEGISIAAGPACSARSPRPSSAVQALGYNQRRAECSVRISLGEQTTAAAVRRLGAALRRVSGR